MPSKAQATTEKKPPLDSRMLVYVPPHPLIKHWVSVLRNEQTPCPIFKEIAKLFPKLFGQPPASLKAGGSLQEQSLKIGVVLSGGQAPGGHNVISGIFDYLQNRTQGSTMYGFRGGPAGVMKCKYVKLTEDFVYPYRNQGGFDMICSGRDKIETPGFDMFGAG